MSADDFRRGVAGATVPALIERTFAPARLRGATRVLPGLPSRPSLSATRWLEAIEYGPTMCCRGYRPGPH